MGGFKGDGKRNFTFRSKYNVTNNYFIPYQMHYHTQTILTTQNPLLVCTTLASGVLCDVIFAKHHVVPQFVYERSD